MICQSHYAFRALAEGVLGQPDGARVADYSLEKRLINASARKMATSTRLRHSPTGPLSVLFLTILVALLGSTLVALAQDRNNGELIANTQCSRCHVIIGTSPREAGPSAIPSFSEIADMPSTNEISLREFLSMSHPWMPNYRLTRQEVADVASYILSLKR